MGGVRSLTENSVNFFFFFFLNPSLSLLFYFLKIRIGGDSYFLPVP